MHHRLVLVIVSLIVLSQSACAGEARYLHGAGERIAYSFEANDIASHVSVLFSLVNWESPASTPMVDTDVSYLRSLVGALYEWPVGEYVAVGAGIGYVTDTEGGTKYVTVGSDTVPQSVNLRDESGVTPIARARVSHGIGGFFADASVLGSSLGISASANAGWVLNKLRIGVGYRYEFSGEWSGVTAFLGTVF